MLLFAMVSVIPKPKRRIVKMIILKKSAAGFITAIGAIFLMGCDAAAPSFDSSGEE